MEALDVVEHIGPGLGQGQVATTVYTFSLEQAEEALHRRVVPAVTDCTHAAGEVMVFQELLVIRAGELGGFNRSSQHLQPGGVYGTTRRLDEAIDRERRDALSGCAFAST